MKNIILMTLLFSHFFYCYAMHSPVNSLPRTHLIPLDEEQNSFKSFIMGSPPRVSRSSHGQTRELNYLDFDDNAKTTKNIYEIKENITRIKARMNEDIALVLPLETLPAQGGESFQWRLSKCTYKLEHVGNAFGSPDTQASDSIALIFKGKTKGVEELVFLKETIEGDPETRTIHIEIE